MPSSRLIALMLLAAVGCSAEHRRYVSGLIQGEQLYSAYDGEHDYRVVARAAVDELSDAAILHWSTDREFVEQHWYRGMPGAVLLTTKRTGTTQLELSVETSDGEQLRAAATLEIAQASSEEWARGDEYYSRPRILADLVKQPEMPPECGMPGGVIPDTSCVNCHNDNPLAGPLAGPLDPGRYTDERLIATFAHGEPPLDGLANQFLRQVAQPECVFALMHSPEDLDDETTRGLVWKLRSLDP